MKHIDSGAREQLLREHQLVFERAQVGIVVLRDRIVQRCNTRFEEILGYGPGELIGKSTRLYYPSEEAWLDVGRRAHEAVAANGSYSGEDVYLRRDGRLIRVHVAGSLINPDNPEEGYVWLYDDVTAQRDTEDALKALLREHSLIFERAQIGIMVLRNRVIERCNPRFEEIMGYGPGELLGKSTRIFYFSDEDWDETGRRVYTAIAEAGIFSGEDYYRRSDDRSIPIQVNMVLIDPEHPEAGIVGLYDDVTETRRSEAALKTLLSEQTLIFERAHTGIMFVRDRVIQRCNPRFEEIFGHPRGALVGRSTRVLFPDEQAWVDNGIHVYSVIEQRGILDDVLSYVRGDGATIFCHVIGSLLEAGNPDAGTVWLYEDITARRATEQALQRSHDELERRVAERTAELSQQLHFMEQLIEAIPGPVYYKDRQGRYLGFNQRYLDFFGKQRSQLLGATVDHVAPHGLADDFRAADEELFRTPGAQIYETPVRHANGELLEVMCRKATFANPDGSVGGLIGVMFDITERKRLEDRMRQAAMVFDISIEGITITSPDGTIIAVNRAFTEITGYSESEILGRNPRLLKSDRHDADFYREMWEAIGRCGRWQGEIWNRRKDGSLFPERLSISAVTDASGNVTHYVGVFSDITEIKRANDLLDHQAHHDHLTGLPNRLLLGDRLQGALLRAQREQTQVAVMFIDLDRFKNINDNLGHHVGDSVLCEVARRFCALTRESDTVARLGGDEFLIVMEGIHEPALASRIADKILDDLRANPVTLEQEFFVGASIGISLFPQDGEDSDTLLRNADAAMYRAKERGRNTYEFFSNDLTQFSLDRFKMETDLRRAIERDELVIYLQPQFSLASGALIGAEALVRWLHPQQGLVSPGKFIPLAEESGLIVALGEWVQQTACRCWAGWVAAGFKPGVLSINVSGVEFRRGLIQDTVRGVLAATGLPPALLELEITEGAIMSQAESSIQVLHDLRAMGLSLAIDDFGTGYSSLAYLKRLPLNKLKVDQSFVRGLPSDPEDRAIARAVIALGHSLQLKVIAEGVETEEQRAFLIRESCDEMQGFLLGRPMPVDEFRTRFLEVGATGKDPA